MAEEAATNGAAAGMPEDLTKYTQDVFKAIVAATRCAKALPKLGDNYELYSSYPVFAQLMEAEGERILQLISKLCHHAGANTHFMEKTLLPEDRMERLLEVNDYLLERVGNLLDEAAGLRRPEDLVVVGPDIKAPLGRTIATSWNRALHSRQQPDVQRADSNLVDVHDQSNEGPSKPVFHGQASHQKPLLLLGSSNVFRPQTQFSDQIDNSNKPFVPKLRFKHNAKERQQHDQMRILDDDKPGVQGSAMDTDMETSSHPYKYELDHFEPESWQFDCPSEVIETKPVEETPLIYVSNESQLEDLCRTLKSVREFAVDLEHHSYRTFQGLTCLMQISTRTHDYIVDTLALWRHIHILNDPFTDPSIMKVFHGSSMDVIWLQRDFGIYVVNMFDTGQAARQLNFPRLSLAYLIQHYCGEELEKQYQMADWRIRPLPDELLMYARKDTHFLLSCCDRLRQELLNRGNEQKNLLRAVFTSSRDICLSTYQKPLFSPDDYLTLLAKSRKRFNTRQLYALKQLYAWRDHLARVEDEAYWYVLPDHMLLQIAEVLPRELQGIWACCSPVPPLVRQDAHALHRIILHARTLSLDCNEGRMVQADRDAAQKSKYGASADTQSSNEVRSNMLKCHDFSHTSSEEEIVPLFHRLVATSKPISTKEPSLSFFFNDGGQPDNDQPPRKKLKVTFNLLKDVKRSWNDMLTPYDQYLLAMAHLSKSEEGTDGKRSEENIGKKPKKMYSHLDKPVEVSEDGSGVLEEPNTSSGVAVDAAENSATSKRPKKKRKAGELMISEQLAEVIPSKKSRRRSRKPKADMELTETYDYAATDKTIFSKGAATQKGDVFEPHKEFLSKREKKKKKLLKKGATGTLGGGGWKKKSAAAFASFDASSGGGGNKGKKGGKR